MKIFLTTFITLSLLIISGYILFVDDQQIVDGHGIVGFILPPAILGLIYIIRGGSLPDWIYKFTEQSPFGGTLTSDNDPRNISPKIYLPVLIIALSLLAIGWVYATREL